MHRTTVRLLTLVLVTGATLRAQEALYTLRVDVPWVLVDVTVTDQNGRAVSNLKNNDFEVLENGAPQEIQSFTPISAPYNILLLFDRSGSTEHKWPFMQRAAAGFIANLRPQDRIAMDSFDFEFQPFLRWNGVV
jgi:Ca-activated chloride channel homolog